MASRQSIKEVECPLLHREIKAYDCIENRDIVDGYIGEEHLMEGFKSQRDWKSVCRACKWHNY